MADEDDMPIIEDLALDANKFATPLCAACHLGDANAVRRLIADGALVEDVGDDGRQLPLSAACSNGHIECVQLLIDADASVDGPYGRPQHGAGKPIYNAWFRGHKDVVQLLSSYGAARACFLHAEHEFDDWNPAREAHLDILAWLTTSRDWCTPLHHVAVISEERAITLLRDGASVHARNDHADPGAPSPLELASSSSAVGRLILAAAAPWSPSAHCLFPLRARAYAVDLLLLGHHLDSRMQNSLMDVWLSRVMPEMICVWSHL